MTSSPESRSFLPEVGVEIGTIPSPRAPQTTPPSLVIASYNIRYAVGQFLISTGLLRKAGFNLPRRRAETVAANISAAAKAFSEGQLLPLADVLMLQEADRGTERAGRHHVARELAEQLGMFWTHVPAGLPRGIEPAARQWWLDFEEQIGLQDPGDTGVAILSRLPVEDVIRIDLPWKDCPWRPRLSVGATIAVGAHKIRVFNSHIDPHSAAGGQMEQIEVVLSEAEKFAGPKVVLGDFNTLSTKKCRETRRLLESHGYTTPFPTGTATWRGAGIRLHADWIFLRGLKAKRWGVAKPLNVSDHWPVWLELDLANQDDGEHD